jgi:hypothetical protein
MTQKEKIIGVYEVMNIFTFFFLSQNWVLLFFPTLDIFEEKTNQNKRILRDTSNPNDFNFIFYSFIFIEKKVK